MFSIIGLPAQQDWPQNVSLPWQSFYKYTAQPLENVIPEICSDGIDLIKVSNSKANIALDTPPPTH